MLSQNELQHLASGLAN